MKLANHSNLKKESEKKIPLFILGSGPSLKDHDLSKLSDKKTMAFNRSFIAYDDWGFDPTYYAALDRVVNRDNKESIADLIKNSNIQRFFFSRDETSESYFKSEKSTLIDIVSDPKNVNLDFTGKLKVANTGLFGLQVAIGLLRYTEIYLLGCDANLKDNVDGVEVRGDKYFSDSDKDPNHFRPDYYGKGTVYNRPQNMKYHYPAWKLFYEKYLYNNLNLQVYNCSKRSRLQFFDFKPYEEALAK